MLYCYDSMYNIGLILLQMRGKNMDAEQKFCLDLNLITGAKENLQ
jgi:hypothetical protein